ncbi:MAG: hypothetical protein AMXMBFR84_02460 [Candidatus Hydrogenedentota bacterium]
MLLAEGNRPSRNGPAARRMGNARGFQKGKRVPVGRGMRDAQTATIRRNPFLPLGIQIDQIRRLW